MVASVWWLAGTARTARLVNAASTVSVRCRAPTTASAVSGRPALPVGSVRSDAEAARIAADRRRASTSSVWIRASRPVRPVGRMPFARAPTMYRGARVRPVSRVIQYRSRAVCVCRVTVRRRSSVPLVTPASPTSVPSLARRRRRPVAVERDVPSVNDATPVSAPRFATPTTTVFPARCAVRPVSASRDVPPMGTVHRSASARLASAGV
uniref:Putative secreted protein n=1 Tax=Anopheles triannulatus TaxID=58253 RepID=A0A2M4B204_9DIPT